MALTALAPAAAVSQPHQVRSARAKRPDNGFSPAGPWNTRLPAKVPLAPNSAAVVHSIVQDVHNNFGFWALNTDTYSSPIFTVGPHTPVQNWAYTNCLHQDDRKAIASSFAHVPTPRHLIASKGTDAATAIYQPSTGGYWDFWRAKVPSSPRRRTRAPTRPATARSIPTRPCWTRRTAIPGTPSTSCSTRYR